MGVVVRVGGLESGQAAQGQPAAWEGGQSGLNPWHRLSGGCKGQAPDLGVTCRGTQGLERAEGHPPGQGSSCGLWAPLWPRAARCLQPSSAEGLAASVRGTSPSTESQVHMWVRKPSTQTGLTTSPPALDATSSRLHPSGHAGTPGQSDLRAASSCLLLTAESRLSQASPAGPLRAEPWTLRDGPSTRGPGARQQTAFPEHQCPACG